MSNKWSKNGVISDGSDDDDDDEDKRKNQRKKTAVSTFRACRIK